MDAFPAAFGPWQLASSPAEANASFDLAAAPPSEQGFTWRKDLPAHPQLAAAALQQSEARLQSSLQALEAVPAAIDNLVGRLLAEDRAVISFDSAAVAGLAPPESELLRLLAVVEPDLAPLSYGWAGDAVGDWAAACRQFQLALGRIQLLARHLAWVETRVGAALVGRSAAGWTGDLATSWGSGLDLQLRDLHRRSLAQALASRNALLRMLAITTQGALKLSVLIAAPGGALLALPVAWKYANQVLAQLDQYRQSLHPIQESEHG